MLKQDTFDSWAEQKVLLETQYPYLEDWPVELNRSQAILSSVDELHDETNPFDISFRPRTAQQGREFDEFMSQQFRRAVALVRRGSNCKMHLSRKQFTTLW
jgi:hypothetical protein